MPNGHCLRCDKPLLQGITPHYCEDCLKALGLEYDEKSKKLLEKLKKNERP